ncbi:hypothetical protein PUNSTDRAFT_68334 [Punctularia strigosozonata HHB-11173 SS5]|uniref:uncharacterized protein n=1 Tax=Punctularia strigosozonata (strain HHB-11173) TaxID=741275 RepID=UPI000441790D|nr:uncharacterized protein PUNSTDRAFT_68334 [Punctularia strigosozonata HHB-11173 SS5]EIN09364.1 hypothetical protein PUNSTDRAFT_68334 [Punctularia strigosozonata HHB-11173 SS5]
MTNYVEAFYKLSQEQNWGKDRFKAERWKFQGAYRQDFGKLFGTDPNCLESWQELCRAIGIDEQEIPDDLLSCQELIHSTHVNIQDLVDYKLVGTPVQQFPTVSDLSKYCYRHHRFFPLDVALRDTLLQHLLRKVR